MNQFNKFNLKPELIKAIEDINYNEPTPIQNESIPIVNNNNDLLGCAQTGTGKTAAFALPILNSITKTNDIQVLVLAPTRELAIQIKENFVNYSKYLNIRCDVIFGGVKQGSQVRSLQQGIDVLIATPGRLLDLIDQGYIKLKNIKYFVLDEADNMLDMGFIHDINKIIKYLPKKRQTLMFSATMPKEIKLLAQKILKNPIEVSVAPISSAIDTVRQTLYYVNKENKQFLLLDIMEDKKYNSTIIFTRTKRGADKLAKFLKGFKFKVAAIHGNKSQSSRSRTLKDFKDGKINTLIATDIAARGLDISDLSYVVNYDIPNIPESYVHRIGRTGRAGQSGESISFCSNEEKEWIKDIKKLMNKDIEIIHDHNYIIKTKTVSSKNKTNNSSKNSSTKKKASNSPENKSNKKSESKNKKDNFKKSKKNSTKKSEKSTNKENSKKFKKSASNTKFNQNKKPKKQFSRNNKK